ncbi:MAG: zinc ribbon domain-containing protein [Dehalococcoidia bacterium]|nr:zinc ribbon domain-containing protein [Dehalococcoidia bacterium]
MFCTRCGKPNRDGANYCTYCGANMHDGTTSPTVTPQPGIARALWIAGIAAFVVFLGMVVGVSVCTWALYQEDVDGEHVVVDGMTIVGADGNPIRLIQNPDARDPSWSQLRQFLYNDRTDRIRYDDDSFVCADFAELLHNNAEKAGIRAGYVVIEFAGDSNGHACNVFHTTDRGTIYVDDTGDSDGGGDADKTVDLAVGEDYCPVSIFGNRDRWSCMGIVSDFDVIW